MEQADVLGRPEQTEDLERAKQSGSAGRRPQQTKLAAVMDQANWARLQSHKEQAAPD